MTADYKEARRLQCLLDEIREGISAIIEGGQSVSIGDLTYTEASLSALIAYEHSTKRDLEKARGRKPPIVGVNLSGMPR